MLGDPDAAVSEPGRGTAATGLRPYRALNAQGGGGQRRFALFLESPYSVTGYESVASKSAGVRKKIAAAQKKQLNSPARNKIRSYRSVAPGKTTTKPMMDDHL